MALVTCGSCQAINDIPIGHAFCSACGGKVHSAPPGALSAPAEEYGGEGRGKALSITAISFAGAGVLVFPGFALVGLVLGIIALARGAADTWKVLSIIAVVLGAGVVLVTAFVVLIFGARFGIF